MRVVVVTGGIGAGKSTASKFLQQKGAAVVDADRVAAGVLEKGSPVLERVAAAFGSGILLPDGSLDRPGLARLAFESGETVARLNAIVHPAVAREIGPAIANLRLMPNPPEVVVLEVPLLVEAPVFGELGDLVIAIAAPEELRVTRSVAWGREEGDVRRRLAVQATDAQRAALADVVILNDADKKHFLRELERVWHKWLAVGEGT
jgi:dephospho-CoA kinase